jgi:hypothetical protein
MPVALKLVELVAPSIPTVPTLTREQIQPWPRRKLFDALIELVGLARMLANRCQNDVANVIP